MGIVPNSTINVETGSFVDESVSISKTLALADTAEDLVLVPGGKKGRKFSLVNEGPGSAFIAVDSVATLTSTEIKFRDTWFEDGVTISTKLSFIGEVGKTPSVRGVLWAGA